VDGFHRRRRVDDSLELADDLGGAMAGGDHSVQAATLEILKSTD
jgi:hypothetical protein